MSESEKCKEKSEEVADDWEIAGDDAIVASVAERQKQLEQYENKLAVEQEQLKIHQTKPTGAEKSRPEIGDGPIRLLRRPRKGEVPDKTDAELEAEAEERAHKALEEREVLYQQTRERIFGGEQQPLPQPSEAAASSSKPQQSSVLSIQPPPALPRDHLSDVPMKRANQRKQRQQPPPQQQQQLPPQYPPLNSLPLMMPPPQIPMQPPLSNAPPWFFNGMPPPPVNSMPLMMNGPPMNAPWWFNNGPPPYGAPVPPVNSLPMRMPLPNAPWYYNGIPPQMGSADIRKSFKK